MTLLCQAPAVAGAAEAFEGLCGRQLPLQAQGWVQEAQPNLVDQGRVTRWCRPAVHVRTCVPKGRMRLGRMMDEFYGVGRTNSV